MPNKYKCKFYAVSKSTGLRQLFTFKVDSEKQAKHLLWKNNVPFGYLSEYNKVKEISNKKIIAEKMYK
jgi:hypothetical protein